MFENVVVGVKDREAGLDAIELARRLLAPDGTLLLVDVRDPRRVPAPRLDEIEPRLAVQELGPLRAEAGVDADLLSVHARTVAAGLHDIARERGDLLVIGASRRDYYERVYIGDDTRALLKDPPCTVAVAPAGYAVAGRPLRRIGVAYDGSPGSERALTLGRSLAHSLGAELAAFGVVPEPLRTEHPLDTDREIGQLVAAAQTRLAELPDVAGDARYGEPAEELARYGDVVDLLIVGPHKQRPVDRFWGGSTAQRVADDVHCPLLVLSRAVTP